MYTKSQVQQFTSAISTESVQHDPKNLNFYVTLGEHKAFVEYSLAGNVMKLNHTVVPEILGGKGVGKVLAEVCFLNGIYPPVDLTEIFFFNFP